MKQQNHPITGLDKCEESQVNGTDQIFNKTVQGKFRKLRKDNAYKYKKNTEHQIDKMER